MTSDLIVIGKDAKAAGFCGVGVRRWMRGFNLDMGKFLKDGLPADVFLATHDPHAIRLVEEARKRVAHEQQAEE